MKKTITITLIIALISCIFLSIPVSATTADNTERTIEYLDNGDYIETIITDDTANPGIFFICHKYNYKNKILQKQQWYCTLVSCN